MTINPGSPAPPHQQIAATLRSQIVSGAYPPGERLPSIPALTERFGVAKQTVQRAIDQLRLEGAVVTKPGSGTYVRGTRRRHAQLSRGRYGTVRGYHADRQTRYRQQTYAVGAQAPPTDVARAFGVPQERSLLVRRHLVRDGEQPVELGATWLSPETAAGTPLDRRDPLERPLYQVVEDATGRRYGKATDQITARLASPDEARLLRIRPDTPVLVLLHVGYDTGGVTLEVSQTCRPGPTSALVDEYQVPGLTPGGRDEVAAPEPGSDLTLA